MCGQHYSFVSFEDVVVWTRELTRKIPNEFDVIIGIPRSGLLVANLIALKFGRPLSTPELFVEGKFWLSRAISRNNEFVRILFP